MMHQARRIIVAVSAGLSLLLAGAAPLQAAGETMYDYTKIPPFIEVGLNPNLLMVIDNSASMYDPAYAPANDNYCYDDAYDPNVAYAGYFDSTADKWYYYLGDFAPGGVPSWPTSNPTYANWGFYPWPVATSCANWSGYGTVYGSSDLCLMIDEIGASGPDPTNTVQKVNLVFAKGRYLNWLASSKFDVEKEILTGGKFSNTATSGIQMVSESRGCLEKRFIKKTPVTKGGVTYQATFGVRPPTAAEKALAVTGDTAYNGAVSNTRIEIFKPTIAGFSFAPCQAAIDAWTDPAIGLGTLKLLTTGCLEAAGASNITASHTAFNHILQECWYYKHNGAWQPGAGTVTSLQSDCVKVYGAASGSVAPLPAGYKTPGSLSASEVCSGQYNPIHPVAGPWGSNYVGQCWEEDFTVPMVPKTCPAGSPVSEATAIKDLNNYWYYCNGGLYTRCGKNALNACKAPDWAVWYVPGAGSPLPSKVYWTDDNGDGGYACVDQALKKYCKGMDEVSVVDSTQVSDPQGTAWGIPAVLVDTAAVAQLGNPLLTMKGLVRTNNVQPTGLIQEFKYNLRMGAMQFNPGPVAECTPALRPDGTYRASLYDCLQDKGELINAFSLPDASKLNGGKVVRPIDDGDVHVGKLVTAINNINATAWTPLAEAYLEAVGYYTQRTGLRLNAGDYVCDQDGLTAPGTYPAWAANTAYAAGAKVRFAWDYDNNGLTDETKVYFTDAGGTSTAGAATIGADQGVRWTPFDPVLAGCQVNNILLITDGGSTADLHPTMTNFVTTAGNNDGDTAATYAAGILETANYECKTTTGLSGLYGSSLLDDLSFYANRNGSDIFAYPTVDNLDKKKITTYVVAAGTLQDDGTTYECNPKTQLQQVAANSGTTLLESTDPSQLEQNLRKVFELIGGEPSSGSAASVISNSRSGEGAIYQAVFYPKQQDQGAREISWAGDVHALWLDELGNIRQDCGATNCVEVNDLTLDKKVDQILEFFTDPITNAARARAYSDANGDGVYASTDLVTGSTSLSLREIRYLWSAGEWLAKVNEDTDDDDLRQRAYGVAALKRHIITSVNGRDMIPFTATAVGGALSAAAYMGYFKAATADEANDIIGYVRGDDTKFTPAGTPRKYRSRQIDWDENGTVETWKLGDIVSSTPTIVGSPAEDFDLIYNDKSYLEFKKRYRNRRTMVYAGGNDGGLHAFNAGYYDRGEKRFDKAPPADVISGVVGPSKAQYDLGAEIWMFVPKNLFPHLKWLTKSRLSADGPNPNNDYSHVNYVDLKPYIFDAKIFAPDTDHPNGWGTVLVGGMGFGGGNIGVDLNGDGADDEIMRSAYFVLDITNPEEPPVILAEFSHEDLGFTTAAPTAFSLLRCEMKVDCPDNLTAATTWPMDWYLAFPSGPHGPDGDPSQPLWALNGKSNQWASLFTLPIGGTNPTGLGSGIGGLGYVRDIAPASNYKQFTVSDVNFPNSFFSDIIAVDYDRDFKDDSLYFGSVANADRAATKLHTGGLHRLVLGQGLAARDPANWVLNTFFQTPGYQPVTAAPSVASDSQRAWVYFGTGRYFSAYDDKSKYNDYSQQSYYGLKERYNELGKMDLTDVNRGNLVDVSKVWVEEGNGILHLTSGTLAATNTGDLAATNFKALDLEMSQKVGLLDKFHGWKLDFSPLGERNLGQAAILGNVVTFTTFVPETNLCNPEGNSYLWAVYYRTGTAYFKPVMGTATRDDKTESLRKVNLGVGLASTPNIHRGSEEGSKAFVQTSTGAIVSIEQDNPGVVKSGMTSWRELSD